MSSPSDRTVLYEAPAPYFTTTYNTFVSVVSGAALAVLLREVLDELGKVREFGWRTVFDSFEPDVAIKYAAIVWVIATLWHRYFVHNQYLVWRLGVWDVIYPLGFAVLEGALIKVVRSDPMYCMVLAALFSWGSLAYWNTARGLENPHAESVYREHFRHEAFSKAFLEAVKEFSTSARSDMLWGAGCSAVAGVVAYRVAAAWPQATRGVSVCVGVLTLVALYFVSRTGLTRHLDETPTLDKYRKEFLLRLSPHSLTDTRAPGDQPAPSASPEP